MNGNEKCDDGSANGTYGKCNTTCTAVLKCGDGIVNGPEQCDDGGNNGDNNACTSQCKVNTCGDKNVCNGFGCGTEDGTELEQCDAGTNNVDPSVANKAWTDITDADIPELTKSNCLAVSCQIAQCSDGKDNDGLNGKDASDVACQAGKFGGGAYLPGYNVEHCPFCEVDDGEDSGNLADASFLASVAKQNGGAFLGVLAADALTADLVTVSNQSLLANLGVGDECSTNNNDCPSGSWCAPAPTQQDPNARTCQTCTADQQWCEACVNNDPGMNKGACAPPPVGANRRCAPAFKVDNTWQWRCKELSAEGDICLSTRDCLDNYDKTTGAWIGGKANCVTYEKSTPTSGICCTKNSTNPSCNRKSTGGNDQPPPCPVQPTPAMGGGGPAGGGGGVGGTNGGVSGGTNGGANGGTNGGTTGGGNSSTSSGSSGSNTSTASTASNASNSSAASTASNASNASKASNGSSTSASKSSKASGSSTSSNSSQNSNGSSASSASTASQSFSTSSASSNSSSTSSQSSSVGFCCVGGNFCAQGEGCTFNSCNACKTSSSSASTHSGSSQSSTSSVGQCRGDECANGGNEYCSAKGETCVTTSTLPCILCLPGGQTTGGTTGGTNGGTTGGTNGGTTGGGGGSSSSSASLSSFSFTSSSSSAPVLGYCCVNGHVIQAPQCLLTLGQALQFCDQSHSSIGIIGYSSSANFCTGQECGQGGNQFCNSQGLTCQTTPGIPCIRCMPASSAMSAASSVTVTCAATQDCAGGDTCVNATCLTTIQVRNLPVMCGNGRIDPGEECDHGFQNGKDGKCDSTCHSLAGTCGDGIVETLLGEQCEPSVPSVVPCDGHCHLVLNFCGNGKLDPGEQCDDGVKNSDAPNAHCRPDCTLGRCGDGIVDTPLETCDDGNNVSGDGCSATCHLEQNAPSTVLPGSIVQLQLQQPGNGSTAPVSTIAPPTPTPPKNASSGPATLAIMAAGASAGYAYVRRKKR